MTSDLLPDGVLPSDISMDRNEVDLDEGETKYESKHDQPAIQEIAKPMYERTRIRLNICMKNNCN